MDREHKAGKPFFCWFHSTRMHIWTQVGQSNSSMLDARLFEDSLYLHIPLALKAE
jgi:arylsulfatase